MTLDLAIRPWSGDLTVMSRVLTQGFSDYFVPLSESEDDVHRQVLAGYADTRYSFVAWAQSEPVGAVLAATRSDGRARIHTVAVVPSWRAKRVGLRLMQRALGALHDVGAGPIHLEVLEQNEKAIRLYDQLGFRRERRLVCLRTQRESRPTSSLDFRPLGSDALVIRGDRPQPPLHRDVTAIARMRDMSVSTLQGTSWIAWRPGVLLEVSAVSLPERLDDLLCALPNGPFRMIDLPENDPLVPLLRGRGWVEYARQWEMTL